jgi:hypothetical protein
LSFSERRIPPIFASLNTPKNRRPEPLLTHRSMTSLPHLDNQTPIVRSKRGPNSVLPPLRSMHAVAHHRSPKLPDISEPENWDDELDGNRFVSLKKDQASAGIRPTTRIVSTLPTKRRIKQSPRVLAGALSASSLLRLPCHPFRARLNPSERPSPAPPPCPFFLLHPDENLLHIPL